MSSIECWSICLGSGNNFIIMLPYDAAGTDVLTVDVIRSPNVHKVYSKCWPLQIVTVGLHIHLLIRCRSRFWGTTQESWHCKCGTRFCWLPCFTHERPLSCWAGKVLGVHHEQNKEFFLSHLSLIYNMKDRVMIGAASQDQTKNARDAKVAASIWLYDPRAQWPPTKMGKWEQPHENLWVWLRLTETIMHGHISLVIIISVMKCPLTCVCHKFAKTQVG